MCRPTCHVKPLKVLPLGHNRSLFSVGKSFIQRSRNVWPRKIPHPAVSGESTRDVTVSFRVGFPTEGAKKLQDVRGQSFVWEIDAVKLTEVRSESVEF